MDPALITGGTAVATGLIGYLGARLQHKGELQRVQLDRDRLQLEQTQISTQRSREQLEQRRALYLDFLDIAERAWLLATRREPVHETDMDTWWVEYQHVRRRLVIGGAEDVVEQFQELNPALVDVFTDLVNAVRVDEPAAEATHEQRLEVWSEHHEAVDAAWLNLQESMRADLDVERSD